MTELGWNVLAISYSEYGAGKSRVSMVDLLKHPVIQVSVVANPQELKECLFKLQEDDFVVLHQMAPIRVLNESPSVEYRDSSSISIAPKGIEWIDDHKDDEGGRPIGFQLQ